MNQLRALLWLRWLEFKFVFRRREGIWNIVAVILLFVLLAPAAVGVGVGAGFLAYNWHISTDSRQILLLWVHLLLAASFFGYHLTNLFDPQRFEAYDLNRFRQFPVSIFHLYRLNLLASVNDMVFLFFIPAQIGLVVGLVCADGWRGIFAVFVLLVYNGLNLAWTYWVGSLIGGFVQARWRKELLLLFLPGLALVVYMLPYWWFHSHQDSGQRIQSFQTVIEYLAWCPSGWVVNALDGIGRGHSWLFPFVLLIVGAFAGYRSGLRRVRKMLIGQVDVQSLSIGKQSGDSWQIQKPWLVRLGFSPSFSALIAKEFRYLLRTSQGRYAFIWPIFIVILLRIFSMQSESNRAVFKMFETYRLIPFVGFYFFFLLPFFVDLFGYDQKGVRLYYLAPISFQKILIAKNLAVMGIGTLCFLEFLLLSPLAFGRLSALACVYALAALTIGFPLVLTGGNFISCYFPRPLKPNTLRGNNPPHAAVVLGMISIGVTSLPTIAIVLLSEAVHPLMGVGVAVLLLMLSTCIYWLTLNAAARRYEQRGEKMMQILTRTEKAG